MAPTLPGPAPEPADDQRTPGMATAPARADYLPEDLLAMSKDLRYELVEGQLVEMPAMGAKANLIASELFRLLINHVKVGQLGLCFSDGCGYQCFAHDPKRVRFPDGSFVRSGRLPGDKPPDGHMRIAPDLAIEVVSP